MNKTIPCQPGELPMTRSIDPSQHPNPLAAHYQYFRVAERLLLTGHSHQAWPDCGLQAQQQAWLDAARLVDDKWETAAAQVAKVQGGYARLLDDATGQYALAMNTHELVVKWLSALPLRERPVLVTTDGEFHSIRRQLDRLAEEGLEIVKVSALPVEDLAARLAAVVNDRTAAVLVSSVLYRNGRIVPNLGVTMQACRQVGAELLVDAYHSLNVVPLSLPGEGLEDAYVTGAGYKYCQLGEGNGFLRLPADCRLRPVITGWFAEFEALAGEHEPGQVVYGEGASRFAGATFDPTSHYRAAAVFDFFAEQGLTVAVLREISQHQVDLLARRFDELDLDPARVTRDRSYPVTGQGGFLVLESPQAGRLSGLLKKRDVFTDFRETSLRVGPAPYLSDHQLGEAIGILGEVVNSM
jgi:kynureninase